MSGASLGLADIAATVYPPETEGRFNMKCVDYSADETFFCSVQAEAVHRYSDEGGDEPHPIPTPEEGTLHICSRSAAIFEPDAIHLPLVRIPFRETTACGEPPETAKARAKLEKRRKSGRGARARRLSTTSGRSSPVTAANSLIGESEEDLSHGVAPVVLLVAADAHFELKPGNRSAAYLARRRASSMRILLHGVYTKCAAALSLQLQLWAIHQRLEDDYSGAELELTALLAAQEELPGTLVSLPSAGPSSLPLSSPSTLKFPGDGVAG